MPLGAFVLLVVALAAGCDGGSGGETPETQPAKATDLVHTAERGPVRLRVEIDRGEVSVPEPVTLTVTVESERGVDVTMPDLDETFGEFEVVAGPEGEPVDGGFTVRRVRVYTLESFVPGEQAVPSIAVAFADRREKADGSRTVYEDIVTTEPIPVTVRPGLADVKGPVTVRLPGWQKVLLWAIGAVGAMVAIALLARWWRRRRREAERALPWALRVPPHEWALAELDKLAEEDLIGRGRVQEYYYRINGLLRRYIELRFTMMAGEQTSEEFLRALQDSAMFDEDHKEVLRRFVRACDPVKYARYQPGADEICWVQAAARDFVLETARTEAGGASGEPATTASRGTGG